MVPTVLVQSSSLVNQLLVMTQVIYQIEVFVSWGFDNLMFTNELLVEALHILSTCLPVNNKWSRKLNSLVQIIFNDNLKVKSVAYCVPDFNLLNC